MVGKRIGVCLDAKVVAKIQVRSPGRTSFWQSAWRRVGVTGFTSAAPATGTRGGTIPDRSAEGAALKYRRTIAITLAACALSAAAQTVYESKDKAGPVFSDKPSPGAKPLQVEAPNVVSPPAVTPPAPTQPSAAPAYRKLLITRPANQDSVHSNDGAFGISAQLTPPLRANDRVRVLIDGNVVPTVFRSTNPRITPNDWQATALGDRGEHTLQLAVVDADGVPKIESPVVSFYLHRAAVGGKRR